MQVDENYDPMSCRRCEQDNYQDLIHQSMLSRQKREKLTNSQR